MFLANFIFVVSHLKINCSFKYFERSGVIVVKKKSLLKFTIRYSCVLTRVKKI